MTPHEKWMDFSTRLINIMEVTDERREKILKEVQGFIKRFENEEIHGWDTTIEYKFYGRYCIGSIADDTTYFGAYRLDGMDEPKWNSFYNQISAVTRAGLDVATQEWGGGVIGYTIGDIRRMYDSTIPEWVLSPLGIAGDEDLDIDIWL